MNLPSGWELVLVLLVIVVVFGSKRLPDSARALGRSMRILKAETKGLHDDDGTPAVGAGQPVHSVQPVQAAQPVQAVQAVQPVEVVAPVPGGPAVGGLGHTGSSHGSVPVAADGALRPSPTTEQQRQP